MESIRVDATFLQQFIGHTVRIIAQVKQVTGNSFVAESNGTVQFTSDADTSELTQGHWYEIVGIVQKDLGISALQWFDFGDKFNAAAATKLVEVVHRLPELYYSAD